MEQEKANASEIQVFHGNAVFCNNLYKVLSKKDGNIFFSPLSIHVVVSMLYHGADGETAQVLLNALKSSDAEGYSTVMGHLNSMGDVKLMMANKIYGNKSINNKILKKFEEILKKKFGAELEFLDMTDKSGSCKTVNEWVESKTDRKIKNIVKEDMFDEDLISLILINAIYFQGRWASEFEPSSTRKDQFFLEKNKPMEVQMMYKKQNYFHKIDTELDAEIIEIPYRGLTTSMFIILPSESSSIKNLEDKLAKTDVTKIWKDLELRDVHFYLPKFIMEETIELKDLLRQMELANIFDMERADFSKIVEVRTPLDRLHVTHIIQKTFIKVDEVGTEAAAATYARMRGGCPMVKIEPVTFKVDRPAIFMLLASHGATKNILFFGRLMEPNFHRI